MLLQSSVWITKGGRILWNVTAVSEIFKKKIDEKTPCRSTDQQYHVTLFLRRTSRDCISSAQKSCQIFFSAMHFTRRKSGKETSWSQTLKNWRRWTHLNFHARRLNSKEVLTPERSGNFIFPVADGTVKIFGRGQRLRTSTLTRERPERGKEQEIVRGKSDELHSPTPLQGDSTSDDAEAKNDFWTIRGEFIYRPHVVPRVKLYMPKEEIFPYFDEVHRRYQNYRYILDVMMEKHVGDYWNVDGERELSDAWTGFTRFILLNERPPDGCTWSGGRHTRKKEQPLVLTMCGQICGLICVIQQKRKQHKDGLSRNQNSTMPDK